MCIFLVFVDDFVKIFLCFVIFLVFMILFCLLSYVSFSRFFAVRALFFVCCEFF